jgi:hypothetical protein
MEEKPIRPAVIPVVCFSFCVYSIAPARYYRKYSVSELRYFTLAIIHVHVVYLHSYDVTYSH